jgi:hypothetical protein
MPSQAYRTLNNSISNVPTAKPMATQWMKSSSFRFIGHLRALAILKATAVGTLGAVDPVDVYLSK